jgi:hypothetical protein
MNDRELIRYLARQHGGHHRPRWYIQRAKEEFNRDVSGSSVCKAIGRFTNRLQNDAQPLLAKAKDLYNACRFDAGYTRHILERAILS